MPASASGLPHVGDGLLFLGDPGCRVTPSFSEWPVSLPQGDLRRADDDQLNAVERVETIDARQVTGRVVMKGEVLDAKRVWSSTWEASGGFFFMVDSFAVGKIDVCTSPRLGDQVPRPEKKRNETRSASG